MGRETKRHEAYDRRLHDFSAEVRASRLRLDEMGQSSDTDMRLRTALHELEVEQEELRVAEEELREQVDELQRVADRAAVDRERYQQLFEDAMDAHLVTDLFGVVREANATAIRLLGMEAPYMRGRPLVSFCAWQDRITLRGTISTLGKAEPGAYAEEVLSFTPKRAGGFMAVVRGGPSTVAGRLIWTLRPLEEHPGEKRSSSGIYPRFTSNAEATRGELDARELLERERRIREQFERSARAKERFLAVLAHDLRGPLNAVLGWTQFLQREVLGEKARARAYDTIERSARSQLALIEEILDISRLSEDKLQIALTPNDTAAITAQSVEAKRPAAEAKGVLLTMVATEGPLTTFADRRRLEQVFDNLLGNAIKFTPAGGTIEVGARRVADHAEVYVRDTGRGISTEMLPHVFERYHQEESTGPSPGGLGLGLYIARELVELHGGTITATSEGVGRGACFSVRLPLHEVEIGTVAESPKAVALDTHALTAVRIVVVDDDRDTLEIVRAVLEDRGAAVSVATDGAEALALIEVFDPDVVVSDIGLEGEDGYALVRRIRERHSGIGFIALSGYEGRRYVEQAFRAGFDMFLVKPVDAAALTEAVINVDVRRRSIRQRPPA